MAHKKHVVTIKDVAQAANVSVSTVSRVLNGKSDVSSEAQERIQAVIDQLGYTSSLAARSMRSRRKNLIGLVMPDIAGAYSMEIAKGINRAIAESPFDLLIYTMGEMKKSGSLSREQYYISLLNNSLTDGVIVVAYSLSNYDPDSPIVAIDPPEVRPSYPSIRGENYRGSVEAMQHILGLGHRRIGFISGRPDIGSAALRFKGYQDALQQAGIPFDPSLVAEGDFLRESGISGARQLLALEDRPTAIFAANDEMAFGVIDGAKQLGLEVPADVSVVGFDNLPEARFLGLTTVDQNLVEVGYQAVHMLIELIDQHSLPIPVQEMPTSLVVRASCIEAR